MAEWPIKINITEEDFWAPYDSANSGDRNRGNSLDWASDNAWDDFTHLDKASWNGYLEDLVTAFIPKAKAKKISTEDLDRLYEALHEDHSAFESIYQAFIDAATWAWEEAYMPTDGDIRKALEYAIDEARGDANLGDWRLALDSAVKGPKDWSPLPGFSEENFLDETEAAITYEHEGDEWDRFVKFDLMKGPVAKYLRRRLKSWLVDEDGNPVKTSVEDFETNLEDEFVGPVVSNLGRHLEKIMQDVDTNYRVDFHPHWKNVLADKSRAKGVREEILGFLKDYPASEEEA